MVENRDNIATFTHASHHVIFIMSITTLLLNWRGVLSLNLDLSHIFRRFSKVHMNSKTTSPYEVAVNALNGLQSNAAYLRKAREERSANADRNIIDTRKHLKTLGIEITDLDALNVVHVSGSKGKGSTCAFTESIIRLHGFKTGFYSSPHLISVNERIRINGQPLDKELFSEYFWEVYGTIQRNLDEGEKLPPYFQFLTVMAFYVFVKEKVQAAIIEVGIGGLYDCTNIVRKPTVVGVTTLGMDHMNLLGNTITAIAEQKAGIFKENVPAFTVPQPENAMEVLRNEAQAKGCSLRISPPFEFYQKSSSSFTLGVPGIVQNLNAALSLQLSKAWLDQTVAKDVKLKETIQVTEFSPGNFNHVPLASPFDLSPVFEAGLQSCNWPGRFQTVQKNNITLYLDGAHTHQSIKYCVKWFEEAGSKQNEKSNVPVLKVLLFNCTGDRKAETLLGPLSDVHFDLVIFSPNRLSIIKDSSSDQSNFMVDPEQEMQQCITNKEIWGHLKNSMYEQELIMCATSGDSSPAFSLKSKYNELAVTRTLLFPCLNDATNFLFSCSNSANDTSVEDCVHLLKNSSHVQVLVTGSLHLVGGVLSILQSC